MAFSFWPAVLLASLSVHAQTTPAPTATPTLGNSPLPLTQYTFTYPNLPEQVNPFPAGRGPQTGYNICNSTTEGPNSKCQTMFVNDIEDFCLWGSDVPKGIVGNVEGEVVAYCTKPGHGTRLIPPGCLTAVQFIKTPGYIQVTGNFDQTRINLQASDSGGELDPHGADSAGNPLGGLVFSNNLPTSTSNTTYTQVNNWSNFVGSNQFCIKACDNSIKEPDYCQNMYDTEGCSFNMPASYAPNEFTSCLGDNQNAPGGDPAIPATSSCTTYTSSLLYPTATSSAASSSGTQTKTSAGALGTTSKPAGSGTSGATIVIGRPGAGLFNIVTSLVVATLAGVVILL
jgi:hypothetical protein